MQLLEMYFKITEFDEENLRWFMFGTVVAMLNGNYGNTNYR